MIYDGLGASDDDDVSFFSRVVLVLGFVDFILLSLDVREIRGVR